MEGAHTTEHVPEATITLRLTFRSAGNAILLSQQNIIPYNA
jgi:hypothetical protein